MIFLFMLVNSYLPWTLCHLIYPINYCNMAAVCTHDGQMICASTPDGCNRRSFLDQCDIYEYNCDYGTFFEPCDLPSSISTSPVLPSTDQLMEDESGVSHGKTKLARTSAASSKTCWPFCRNRWLTTETPTSIEVGSLFYVKVLICVSFVVVINKYK